MTADTSTTPDTPVMTLGGDNLPAFSATVPPRTRYRSVATLADDEAGLTCSVSVAMHWASTTGAADRLEGYPSFELAADAVRAGAHDAFLVAGAYPEIRRFYFDRDLKAVETFLGELPDMVLAGHSERRSTADSPARLFDTVFHHPATTALMEAQVMSRAEQVRTSTSNSAACRDVLGSGIRSAAITNRTCAEHYELEILDVLAAATPMGFVVFERKEVA